MKGLKRNPNATNSYRMAKILLKLGCVRNFIYLPDNKKDNTYRNCNHETELFLWLLGIRLLDHVFPGAREMGFPVISEMLLISIISFQFPASTSFFMNAVVVSLSPGFLLCKGMAVLSDTKHQAMPYSAKTFLESLPQMLYIWVFQKTFYRIVWCSDSWEPPFLYARKKAI